MNSSDSSLSEGRLGLYYLGMGLSAVGLILFLSVFVSAFQSMGNSGGPPGFNTQPPSTIVWNDDGKGNLSPLPQGGSSPSGAPNFGNALAGMVLIVTGGFLMNIGRAGLRGSGVILDPQGAREDLKPWNTARGGMLDDTLRGSEVVTNMVEHQNTPSQQIVKVRCPQCHTLNDEDAQFCKSCGRPL